MTAIPEYVPAAEIRCAQCGRPLAADPAGAAAWRPADAVAADAVDVTAAMTILCPDCIEAEHAGDFDAGQGD